MVVRQFQKLLHYEQGAILHVPTPCTCKGVEEKRVREHGPSSHFGQPQEPCPPLTGQLIHLVQATLLLPRFNNYLCTLYHPCTWPGGLLHMAASLAHNCEPPPRLPDFSVQWNVGHEKKRCLGGINLYLVPFFWFLPWASGR